MSDQNREVIRPPSFPVQLRPPSFPGHFLRSDSPDNFSDIDSPDDWGNQMLRMTVSESMSYIPPDQENISI